MKKSIGPRKGDINNATSLKERRIRKSLDVLASELGMDVVNVRKIIDKDKFYEVDAEAKSWEDAYLIFRDAISDVDPLVVEKFLNHLPINPRSIEMVIYVKKVGLIDVHTARAFKHWLRKKLPNAKITMKIKDVKSKRDKISVIKANGKWITWDNAFLHEGWRWAREAREDFAAKARKAKKKSK